MTMRLKKGFLLRSVAGRTVVLPDGESSDLHVMITLNDTGRFLWERLETGASAQELKQSLMDRYHIDEALADTDVEAFIKNCNKHGFLE